MHAQFTTSDLIDHLAEAVDAARVAAGDNQRWQNAISAAWDHLLQVDEIEFDAEAHELIYRSESGVIYRANGSCSCQAHAAGQPCKHRAAARLVRRALEIRATHEVRALAAELHAEALEAGETAYTLDIAEAGARSRMEGLQRAAEEWDALAAELQARIGRAWAARAMAA